MSERELEARSEPWHPYLEEGQVYRGGRVEQGGHHLLRPLDDVDIIKSNVSLSLTSTMGTVFLLTVQ